MTVNRMLKEEINEKMTSKSLQINYVYYLMLVQIRSLEHSFKNSQIFCLIMSGRYRKIKNNLEICDL